jgi:hypothetical protein
MGQQRKGNRRADKERTSERYTWRRPGRRVVVGGVNAIGQPQMMVLRPNCETTNGPLPLSCPDCRGAAISKIASLNKGRHDGWEQYTVVEIEQSRQGGRDPGDQH